MVEVVNVMLCDFYRRERALWSKMAVDWNKGPSVQGEHLEEALTCPVQGWGPVVNSVGPLLASPPRVCK